MRALRGTLPRGLPGMLAAGLCLAAAWPAPARPLTLEDLLQREGFGRIAAAPGGRRLVVERRRAVAEAERYDMGRFNPLFRTELLVADLAGDGALRPLTPRTAGFGFEAGPISPDGGRMLVYRLSAEVWELGVADLVTREVRWLGLVPERRLETRVVQWLTADRFLAIVVEPGARPAELRDAAPQAALPPRWAATARGEASVTVVGSGRYHHVRPPPLVRTLVSVSAEDGVAEPLAQGHFTDLEIAPGGRRVALIDAGEEIPLAAGRPVQGPYGTAVRRMRLRLLDLERRRLTAPCGGCDLLASLLAWSPDGDELLVFARRDGAPWAAGRLLRIDGRSGAARRVDDLTPAIGHRPERIYAGWWEREPLVFGRRPGAERDDWHRIGDAGPQVLTAALREPPRRDLAVGRNQLLVVADGAAWRIDRVGRAVRLAEPFRPPPRRGEGIPDRTAFILRAAEDLPGVLGTGSAARAGRLRADGRFQAVADLPPDTRLIDVLGSRILFERTIGGGAQVLSLRGAGADRVLARLNRHLEDVDRPAPVPVPHAGPDGEPLLSWLYLPPKSPFGARPPLVVVPYPGAVHRTAPPIWDEPPMGPAALLLGRGYAVLTPSLPASRAEAGPAVDLAERVLGIVAAAAETPEAAGRFDAARLGLWGHSFGGYGVLSILGQTDRFRAGVATAARTNLTSSWGQFSPWRRIDPSEGLTTPWSAGWTESLQGDMGAPPWRVPERYVRNSPLMAAGRITTPVLLAVGEMDGSHLGQAEEMFSALFRQSKDALLLTYWGEQHLLESPGNLRHFYDSAFAFLEAHLAAGLKPAAGSLPARPAPGSASAAPSSPGPRRRADRHRPPAASAPPV